MTLIGHIVRLPFWARLALLCGLALLLRLAVVVWFTELDRLFEYQLIAQNLVEGRGMSWNEWGRVPLEPTALFPPLYIYWCALFVWLFGMHFLPMFVAQAALSTTVVIPAFLVGREMFSASVGWMFAGIVAVYPEMAYLHARGTPEFLYVVVCLWLLYVYLRLKQQETTKGAIRWSVLLGLVAGLGILLREGVAVVAGACLLVLFLKKPLSWRMGMDRVLPAVVMIMVVLTPWTIRNYVVQHHFIPVRTAYGLNLWMGNHEEATGTDRTRTGGYQMVRLWEKNADYYARSMPLNEWDRSVFYRNEALAYIQSHPGEYGRLTLKRLWYFVWLDPIHPLARKTIYRVGYVVLLLFAIPGLVITVRRHQLDPVIPIIYFGFMFLYVPVIVLPRYRIIPVLLMLLMAGVTADWLRRRWAARLNSSGARSRSPGVAGSGGDG